MKEIIKNGTVIGLTFIGLLLCIFTGFVIAAIVIKRKHKRQNEKYSKELFTVPYEVEKKLILHFELDKAQVN